VAGLDVSSFISHLSRLGIPAIRLNAAETNADLDTLESVAAVVIADASPLIGLARVNGLGWLQALFQEALVTDVEADRAWSVRGMRRQREQELRSQAT